MRVPSVLFTPVPRKLAFSSLGVHAALAALPGCEFAAWEPTRPAPRSEPSGRRLSDFDCVFTSVAWELEVPVLYRALEASGIEPLRHDRPPTQPLVVAGGPVTLSNPELLAPFCDAVFVGEADASFGDIASALDSAEDREDALLRLSALPGMLVPAVHGPSAPAPDPVRAPRWALPTRTTSPHEPNQFGDAFLVEVGRGCPRACTFCVVGAPRRRTTFVPPQAVIEAIPPDASRVGLVGAAVSDHPRIVEIVRSLVERGAEVTLSSVRADRVGPELASLLARGGLRTLTTAADGTSERLRDMLRKGVTGDDLRECAASAAGHGFHRLKIYVMVGLPTETDDDVAEFGRLVTELSRTIRVSVSVSPFVPKRFTPLQDAPFAGVGAVKKRIALLRRLLKGAARLSAASPRIARTEFELSHASGDTAAALVAGLTQGPGVPGLLPPGRNSGRPRASR